MFQQPILRGIAVLQSDLGSSQDSISVGTDRPHQAAVVAKDEAVRLVCSVDEGHPMYLTPHPFGWYQDG
jgi:hypothetical protein